MKKDPLRWMPWDVVAWMLSARVSALSPMARGAYFELLCRQWYDGGLPPDDPTLSKLARVSPEQWDDVKKSVLQFFESDGNGTLRQARCDEEKRAALTRLKRFQKRAKIATKARWDKTRDNTKLILSASNKVCLAEEQNRILPDRTGPDITLPDPPPIPPAQTHAVRPGDGGDGKEKQPAPRGTTTVFDQQLEIARLLDRYAPGDDPFTPDPEDSANALKAIDQITAGYRPGAKLLFLRTLAQFEPLQVCMAAHDWLSMPDLPAGDPKGYFIGMVRGSGKRKYVRYADRVEIKQERKQQDARKREAHGTPGKPLDQSASHAGHPPGSHTAGDILRDLPEVQRMCSPPGQTPPKEADDVPNGT